MIRAAAKNHAPRRRRRPSRRATTPCSTSSTRPTVRSRRDTRHWLANEAFAYTARYDAAISALVRRGATRPSRSPPVLAWRRCIDLSYGENPHQRAALYARRRRPLTRALHGLQAARQGALVQQRARPRLRRARLLVDLEGTPACVIVKHNNPCGVAIGETVAEAYEQALCLRPDLGLRRGDRLQPSRSTRAWRERLHETLHRGADRARLRRRTRWRSSRARRRSGSSRTPSSAPITPEHDIKRVRGGAAGPGHGLRSGRRASRWTSSPRPRRPTQQWERPAVRLEGLPARALERDRAAPRTAPRSGSAPGR